MAKVAAPNEKRVTLNLRFPENLKHEFHVKCVTNHRQMTEVFEGWARLYLAGKLRLPSAPKKPRRK